MDAADNKHAIDTCARDCKGSTKPFIDCLAEALRWNVIGATILSGVIEGT